MKNGCAKVMRRFRPKLCRLELAAPRPLRRRSQMSTQGEFAQRLEILGAALAHVPEAGWTTEALARGAVDAGHPSISHGIFSRGGIELVEYFWEQAALETSKEVKERYAELCGQKSDEERIKAVMQVRLRHLIPYISTWPQAMALGFLPHNVTTTVSH